MAHVVDDAIIDGVQVSKASTRSMLKDGLRFKVASVATVVANDFSAYWGIEIGAVPYDRSTGSIAAHDGVQTLVDSVGTRFVRAATTLYAGLNPRGAWSAVATYAKNDYVSLDGNSYASRVDANLNHSPDTSPTQWQLLSLGTPGADGPPGQGLDFDVQVANIAARAAYDGEAEGFRVLVTDAGSGRAAIYQMGDGGSADWGAAIYVTGEAGEDGEDGEDGADGLGVPAGGTTGQVLAKVSGADNDTEWVDQTGGGGGGREVLSANRTYYVRTDGSDSNTGLADNSGGAFLTIQKAVDVILNTLEPLGYSVTIQVRDGTRTLGTDFNQPWRGSNFLYILGNIATPANCVINTTSDDCFAVTRGCGPVIIRGFKMTTTTSGSCIRVWEAGSKVYYGSCEFGACAAAQIDSGLYGEAVGNWDYTINGNAVSHLHTGAPALITFASITVTLTGTPAFSAYFAGTAGGFQVVHPITFVGSATGKRFVAHKGGVIDAQGKTASFLPGSVDGTWDTGGVYVTGSGVNPSFFAHKNSTNQTGIASATFTKVTFGTEVWDAGGFYDPANSRWTPRAGRYRIDVFVQYNAGVVSGARGGALLYKNGVRIGTSLVHFSSVNGSSAFISMLVEANGTDYFEGFCYADGAGDKTIDGNPLSTFFQGHWISDL